eukprot:scaffold1564_cov174-Amphora_coffeaeformis.AAC.3
MPTLVEEYNFGETARASDIAWVEREFDQGNDEGVNDTTLSGSLLMAALDDFRRTQKAETSPTNLFSPPPQQRNLDQSVSMLDQSVSLLGSPESLLPPQTPQFASPPTTQKSTRIMTYKRETLSTGPNQQIYEEKYKEIVNRAVKDCRRHFPGKIPNYQEMSTEQQRTEQERVLHLLERLQVGRRQAGDKDDENSISPDTREQLPGQCPSTSRKKTLTFAVNKSEVLFSPEPHQDDDDPMETSVVLLSPTPQRKVATPGTNDTPVMSPVEISRAAARFSSPEIAKNDEYDILRKRMATSSGKRGADASRRKQLDESEALPSMVFNSPQPKIFTASQSPILSDTIGGKEDNPRRLRKSGESDEDSLIASCGPNISFGDDNREDPDDTFDSIEESAFHSRPPLGPVGNTVHLKAGASVHFRPLTTQRRRSKTKALTQTFPDPLDCYSGKDLDKMQSTYKWLQRRLKSKSVPGGVVFSLSDQKIIDISIKLAYELAETSYESNYSSQPISSDPIIGQTLIVVRERESLAEWKCAFREGSSLGVLCHCELASKERKSVSTATKCSKYEVVLTTFDALSAPDSNVVVDDEEGIAVVGKSQDQHGWLQGRGSSQCDISNDCRKLSILHRLKWKRVLFVDTLGRKSYMAKPGTSRNKAASVLAAESRVVFFAKDNETPSGFAELLSSDKKALSGVAEVLHTDWERVGNGDYAGKGLTLDYDHALRIRTTSQKKAFKR